MTEHTSPATYQIRIGGLLRCCIQSLESQLAEGLTAETCLCQYCKNPMKRIDNVWEWASPDRWVPSRLRLAEKTPLPPEVLLDARQDKGPAAPRKARAVKARKVTREA